VVPNPYFLLVIEKGLDHFFHTYDGFTYRHAAWELTMGGASHGIVGPVFLLLPLGLLALRTAAGRWLWIAGVLLALPWLSNAGTRFLMPSLPFFALALVLALPRPAAWALLLAQAALCWPPCLDTTSGRDFGGCTDFRGGGAGVSIRSATTCAARFPITTSRK